METEFIHLKVIAEPRSDSGYILMNRFYKQLLLRSFPDKG